MATAYQIRVAPSNSGLLNLQQTEESASKVSELLQRDLEQHYIFFNDRGFHNHIVHHLLALYGTGSGPERLQIAFDDNTSYQRPSKAVHSDVVNSLQQDWEADAPKYLGKREHYSDFLKFFQLEIEKNGWQHVLSDHLFKEDARSDDFMGRLFAGLLHPLIHLMYGIEWQQPAIIAEAMAQTAAHPNRFGHYLLKAEQAAASSGNPDLTVPALLEAARQDSVLGSCARLDDEDRVYDGVLGRAADDTVRFISQAKVGPQDLEERTVEMLHSAAWVASSAAWHPPYAPRYDFILIHHLNASPAFLSINKQDWIPVKSKIRMLEWKIRMDIVQYIGDGCPTLDAGAFREYSPKDTNLVSAPKELLPRLHETRDDGHTIKVSRALLLAQELSRKYAGRPWIRIPDDELWLKAQYMLLDGRDVPGSDWVRLSGFDESWNNFPKAR